MNIEINNEELLEQIKERIIDFQKYKVIVDKYKKAYTRIPVNIRRTECVVNGTSFAWFHNNEPLDFGDVSWFVFDNGNLNFPSNVYDDENGNIIVEWDNLMLAEYREKMMDEILTLKNSENMNY